MNFDEFLAFFVGVFVSVFLTFTLVYPLSVKSGEDSVYREAIERGFAEYCPKTDDFAWLGECK